MPPDPTLPTPGSMVCARWMQPDDFTICGAADFDPPDVFPLVVDAATDMLYAASGRQFPGICASDPERPPAANVTGGLGLFGGERLSDGSLWLGMGGLDTLPQSTFPSFGPSGNVVSSQGFAFSTIEPIHFPIVEVTKITIDGTDLPPGSWRIVDDRWIIRADGQSWPLWQRLDRAAGQPDTWTVEYTFGAIPPPAGLVALQVFVCELGLAWKGDKSCRLPKRLTTITREGFAAAVLDPFKFLDEGKFGIYELDSFVNSTNPHRLSRDGKVLNVDLLAERPHRIR